MTGGSLIKSVKRTLMMGIVSVHLSLTPQEMRVLLQVQEQRTVDRDMRQNCNETAFILGGGPFSLSCTAWTRSGHGCSTHNSDGSLS